MDVALLTQLTLFLMALGQYRAYMPLNIEKKWRFGWVSPSPIPYSLTHTLKDGATQLLRYRSGALVTQNMSLMRTLISFLYLIFSTSFFCNHKLFL